MTRQWEQATRTGDLPRVVELLRGGADVDALDRHGQTALMNAAHRGDARLVALLVENGARLDHSAKYGLTALMLAVVASHHAVVKILLDAGADTTKTCNMYPGPRMTVAELAIRMGREEIAAMLRSRGV